MKTTFLALVSSVAFVACASSRTFDEPLQLSPSTAERNAPPGLAVTVTRRDILVEGNAVAPIAAGKVDPKLKGDGEHGYRIVPLIEALEKRAAPGREAAKRAGKPFDARVTLSFDRSLSYRLFTEVVYSCGQAGYSRYELIVKRATDGSLAAINFVIPDQSALAVATTVWVRLDAFKIVIDGAWVELPRLANGRYDYESLRRRLSEVKASAGDAALDRAVLLAAASIPYEVIVATMDTMRATRDRTPLFPVIQFGASGSD
jgi:biopolymer transport protein ExbD